MLSAAARPHALLDVCAQVEMRAATALLGAALQLSAAGLAHGALPSVTALGGKVRIQALSPTLLRVEPQGPKGSFEDRTTFMVVDRDGFPGTPITKTPTGGKTAAWQVSVTEAAGASGTPSIVVTSTAGKVLFNSSSGGGSAGADSHCKGMDQPTCVKNSGVGTCFWDKDDKQCESLDKTRPNLLHWPSPLTKTAYGLVDYPRFFVPEWEVMPAPKSVAPDLAATNGYDFTNNVNG
jgi:hypothetical protein